MEKILELDLAKQDKDNLELFEKNLSKLQEKIFPLKADELQEPQEQTLWKIKEDDKQGNAGDFRSKDCIELLKLADIVVTNPPFSLFREYVAQLVEYDKKFLIIGNKNAITYKETFSLIKENKIWLGITSANVFLKPNENRTGFILTKQVNGLTRWFSNLTHKKRNEILETISSYKKNPEQYPKYDNYDAINVDKTIEIPLDYDGIMGVPITFLDKHNPKQFEIVGIDRYVADNPNYGKRFSINGREIYARILIRKIAEVAELRKLEFEKM
ncbi:adenine-specific methyltransferase EcoRI family protein [Campylobacter helveticus]|uniref:adenine-specific methyltransferase EcoRI family protein n=1 Tax=Campylobacter helveticus TaxID=28898 RepID=UPI002FDC2987